MDEFDVAIIGAGPAGLYATYYAGFRGMRVVLVDSLAELGGQVSALYPEKLIYDVAGLPSVRGRDLVEQLVTQAKTARPEIWLEDTVEELHDVPDGLQLTTVKGREAKVKAVLITAGIGSFTPRALPIDSGAFAKDVVHFVPRFDEFADLDVVVVGGGDSALDWAIGLHDVARSVTLVHRRDAFRAHEASVETARGLGINMHLGFELRALSGGTDLEQVEIANAAGEVISLSVNKLVAALGFVADLGPINSWNLEMEKRHILVDSTTATSRARVFAAGDVSAYLGKVPLISVGFGEAATAINNLAPLVDESRGIFPGHSSGAAN